ncbi:MAG: 16S rRNA (guanine(966)-N(2))-methyltransferase RsmD [Pseudomonadota bacterium]
MRIVGGEYRGRRLAQPSNQLIRPTTDRNREALFNILGHKSDVTLQGARVLDLFAGTGALGLEAMSRGARFALFVEEGTQGRSLIRRNIETLGLNGRTKLFRRDATKLGSVGSMAPFDLVFADPPYGKGLGSRAAQALIRGGWLAPSAILILEETTADLPGELEGFSILDRRSMGETAIGIYQFAAVSNNPITDI